MKRELDYLTADLHTHSHFSDGADSPADLVDAAFERRLAVLAVTDHDTLEGAFVAMRYLSSHPSLQQLQLLIGMEYTTASGHLIALFPNPQDARKFRINSSNIHHVITSIREHSGLCIVPHPGLPQVGVSLSNPIYEKVDGVEIINGFEHTFSLIPYICINPDDIRMYMYGAHIAEIGSSDTHFAHSVASAVTFFPGDSLKDLIDAIQKRQTRPSLNKQYVPTIADYLSHFRSCLRRYGLKKVLGSILNQPFSHGK